MMTARRLKALLAYLIAGLFSVGVAISAQGVWIGIDGESKDDAHEQEIQISTNGEVEAPQGAPEGTTIIGRELVVQDGYFIKRTSKTDAQVMRKDGGVTGTVTCDPCKGTGACTLSSSGGKLGCTSTCDAGCVTVIKIPLPKAVPMQPMRMR